MAGHRLQFGPSAVKDGDYQPSQAASEQAEHRIEHLSKKALPCTSYKLAEYIFPEFCKLSEVGNIPYQNMKVLCLTARQHRKVNLC